MSVLGSTLGYNRQNEGKCLFNEGKFIITLHRLLLTRNIGVSWSGFESRVYHMRGERFDPMAIVAV